MTRTSKRAIRPGFDDLEGRQLLSNVLGRAAVNHTPAAAEYRNHPAADPQSPTAPSYALATIETHPVQGVGSVHATGSRGSWRETWEVDGKNIIGNVLWRYYLEIDWTSDGRRITSKDAHAWGTVSAPFWTFVGASNRGYGGIGSNYFRVFSQGHFQFHLPQIGSVQDVYPVIDKTVYA